MSLLQIVWLVVASPPATLPQLWQMLDADGSNSVTAREVAATIRAQQKRAFAERLAHAKADMGENVRGDFEDLDADRDGRVGRAEYEAGTKPARADRQQRLFHFADGNADGFLSRDEWFVLRHPELAEHRDDYRDLRAHDTLDAIDGAVNGERDGAVDQAEFWRWKRGRLDPALAPEEVKAEQRAHARSFDVHDGDRDGVLDAHELGQWLAADEPRLSAALEAQAFVQHADADADGSLSLNEVDQHVRLLLDFLARLYKEPGGWMAEAEPRMEL
eukprot:g5067.t1